MRDVIRKVVDEKTSLKSRRCGPKNILTGYGRVGGKVIGIIANQANNLAGCLDINASDKASRFIRHCDAFNIPIVTFVDVPGTSPAPSRNSEASSATAPRCSTPTAKPPSPSSPWSRKAYGGAYLGMCSKALGADMVLAWPQAEIAVMGAEGAPPTSSSAERDRGGGRQHAMRSKNRRIP